MSDKEKHLATFQNLCVIAAVDGQWHEKERALLNEAANSMGLTQADIQPIMSQAAELDFIIPETEGERYLELRMVILMMVHDGKLDPREYEGARNLAKRMNIPPAYVDEVVAFYVEKEKERARHLGIFQNFYLIAMADGYVDADEEKLLLQVAENLGLGQRDVDEISDNHQNLDFVIPDSEDERYYSLKNLVYMMIIDGKVEGVRHRAPDPVERRGLRARVQPLRPIELLLREAALVDGSRGPPPSFSRSPRKNASRDSSVRNQMTKLDRLGDTPGGVLAPIFPAFERTEYASSSFSTASRSAVGNSTM